MSINELDIICINDEFTNEQLAFWREHNIAHPVKDNFYTVRYAIKHSTGDIGFLLNEIINPKVPIKHPVLGTIMIEPTFNYNRFAKINGTTLTIEDAREILSQLKIAA
jgi:hypothetical protein